MDLMLRNAHSDDLRVGVPHGHWKTTTFVTDLRSTRILAPTVLDGPINAVTFRAYVEQILVPELSPDDVVVMDNLGSQNGPQVPTAIEDADAGIWDTIGRLCDCFMPKECQTLLLAAGYEPI